MVGDSEVVLLYERIQHHRHNLVPVLMVKEPEGLGQFDDGGVREKAEGNLMRLTTRSGHVSLTRSSPISLRRMSMSKLGCPSLV